MQEIIHSVGIDIGTSTTQLIFSRLTVENRASSYTAPRIDIVDKEVVYRSDIYFTPLVSTTTIDTAKVLEIVRKEYTNGGKKPEDMHTGAVIITGETARKENASQLLDALSSMAGDFVVATAGPDLESVLSARGAGADTLSEEYRTTTANLDVGGGTTNIAVYQKGKLRGVSCLDIGGRLIKVDGGKISYIFRKTAALAKANGIALAVGDVAKVEVLRKICDLMADHLAQSIGIAPRNTTHQDLYTNDGKPLSEELTIQGITFSGGVADCIYSDNPSDPFRYGDIGVLLGYAIANHPAFQAIKIYPAKETIRATVVGAGTHATEVSGSTISYAKEKLPVKNLPILRVPEEDERYSGGVANAIAQQMPLFHTEGKVDQLAISLSGAYHTGFQQVQVLAQEIIQGAKVIIESQHPLMVVVEDDIGKALGNALNVHLNHKKEVVCIDGISATNGSYIDIGAPIAQGRVVPVVIKTLIFNS